MENAIDSYLLPISPAPGWVLVAPNEKDTTIDGIQLALKGGEYHEGEILAVGAVPRHFKGIKLLAGDIAIYARFSAVETFFIRPESGVKVKGRLVSFQHLAGTRSTKVEKKGWLQKKMANIRYGLGLASFISLGALALAAGLAAYSIKRWFRDALNRSKKNPV